MYREKKYNRLSKQGGIRKYKLMIEYNTETEEIESIEEEISEESYDLDTDKEHDLDDDTLLDILNSTFITGLA